MRSRFGLILCLSLCVVLAVGGSAWATVKDFKSFKEAYPDQKKVSCKVCHQAAMGKKDNLNAYGLALQASKGEGNAKELTEDDYRAIEEADADEDGASNLEEFNAGTDPSDPESVPDGAEEERPLDEE